MRLANAEAEVVEIEKLRDYCPSTGHPRGRHKARVFQSLLGMTTLHAEELRAALLDAALNEEASAGASDQYGTRYIIDFELRRDSRVAQIRSCWILLNGEDAPRFVTCYILYNEVVWKMELLSEVAVLRDMPEIGLVRGQVGTVVEVLAPSVAEVEFCDDQGRAYAMAALRSEELIRLQRRPCERVA